MPTATKAFSTPSTAASMWRSTGPHRLAFDFSVEPFFDEPTRVTIDFVPMGPNICDLVLTHDLGDDEDARANERAHAPGLDQHAAAAG